MSINPSSPVTGAAQTGFTAPTYTLTADTSPGPNSKQWAVTALGGTQSNVEAHTVSKPFTMTYFKPQRLQTLPGANPVTGVIKNIPINKYKLVTRKGAKPASNQPDLVNLITTDFGIFAGVDTYEPEEIKAAISAHIGFLWQIAAGIGDTAINGVM